MPDVAFLSLRHAGPEAADSTLLVGDSPMGHVEGARLTRNSSHGSAVRAQLTHQRRQVDTLLRKSSVQESLERNMWLRPDSLMATPRMKDHRKDITQPVKEHRASNVHHSTLSSSEARSLWRPQPVPKLRSRIRSKPKRKQSTSDGRTKQRRALQLLSQLMSREHFLALTDKANLPEILCYLTENLDRLERYAVVKSAVKESALAEEDDEDEEPDSPGSVKQRTLDAFLGRSVDAEPLAPVQPIGTKIPMSRIAARAKESAEKPKR